VVVVLEAFGEDFVNMEHEINAVSVKERDALVAVESFVGTVWVGADPFEFFVVVVVQLAYCASAAGVVER